ncbi:MAG: NAD(P)-dependent oxidoreductase [Vicinamibacterales bacterium]
MNMTERIGFIGLGVMGKPMAGHLLAKGHGVVVHNRSREAVDALVEAGAKAGESPADVARQSTIVITMVPDTPDVKAVVAGRDGVLDGLAPKSLVIDMSSISPVETRSLAKQIAAKGSAMLDAPVSGGEVGAKNATLSIMVGGDAASFERARPIFECMGQADRIIHVGEEPGSGQICKICNQVAIAGTLAGVSEAFALARKAGVDPARVRTALMGGLATSRILDLYGERILNGNFAPGFRTRLYQKDLRLANEAASAYGVPMGAAALMSQLVDELMARGGGELDNSAVATVLFDKAGIK